MRLNITLHRFLIILCISLCLARELAAEDPDRGRLPDGRAFRVDREGNEIVDYIAELELNVDALTRQVHGLEDENKEKQTVIERLQSGKSAQGSLVERNIGSSPQVAALKEPPQVCEPKIIEREKIVEKECRCPSEVNNKICPQANCAPVRKEEQEICSRLIADARLDQDIAIQKQAQELDSIKAKYNSAQEEIRQARADNEEHRNQLALAVRRAEEAESSRAAAQIAERQPERFIIRNEHAPVYDVPSNAAISQSRIQAVDILRGRMLSDVNSLQGLVSYRDRLYSEARRQSPSIEQPSDTKEPIARIKTKIAAANRVTDLSILRGDINSLRGQIQEEIAIITRRQKAR